MTADIGYCSRKQVAVNADRGDIAKTILAGYYKYGVQTLLTGDFGTTGTIVMEYEDDTDKRDTGRDGIRDKGELL